MKIKATFKLLVPLVCFALFSCQSTYYSIWEKLGKEKRDLLKENVKKVRDDQTAATEEFKDALTQLKELTGFEGGNLEKTYNSLQKEYEQCVSRADTVKNRVKRVEQISSDLFKEWDSEIKSMSNETFKADSRKKLNLTKEKYAQLHEAMKTAEMRMDPVLKQFNDQVLYLKHNLNAQAVAGLQTEVKGIESEVQKLIADMSRSIGEADSFIKALPTS